MLHIHATCLDGKPPADGEPAKTDWQSSLNRWMMHVRPFFAGRRTSDDGVELLTVSGRLKTGSGRISERGSPRELC